MKKPMLTLEDFYKEIRKEPVEHFPQDLYSILETADRISRRRKRTLILTLLLLFLAGTISIVFTSLSSHSPSLFITRKGKSYPERDTDTDTHRSLHDTYQDHHEAPLPDQKNQFQDMGRQVPSLKQEPIAAQSSSIRRALLKDSHEAHGRQAETIQPSRSRSATVVRDLFSEQAPSSNAPQSSAPLAFADHTNITLANLYTTSLIDRQSILSGVLSMRPVDIPPILLEAEPEEQKTLSVNIGIVYGPVFPDFSPLNKELQALNHPPLPAQSQQTAYRIALRIHTIQIGGEFGSPISMNTIGRMGYQAQMTDNPSSKQGYYSSNLGTITTSYSRQAWGLFGEYHIDLVSTLALCVGGSVHFNHYSLAFSTKGTEIPFDPTRSKSDDWANLWQAVNGEGWLYTLNHGKYSIESRSLGVGPSLAIEWSPWDFLHLDCQMQYLTSLPQVWKDNSGITLDGIEKHIQLNEFSIRLGANVTCLAW